MKTNKFARRRGTRQSGQAMLFVVLGLGIFLFGAMAFAIDLSSRWFRRQAAQTAADAACTAGAMDLLVDATNGVTNQGHFNGGSGRSGFDCFTTAPNSNTPGNTKPAPCVYARLNGFESTIAQGSTAQGSNVSVSFPGTVLGVTAPPTSVAPTAFLQVTVTDNSPTLFAGLLGYGNRQNVAAIAKCGVTIAAAPIPILVLDPQTPAKPAGGSKPAALNLQGTPLIQIFGGPQRSIQVNSAMNAGSCGQNNCSVNNPWGSSAQIDLSHAGPLGNGADMAISGSPAAAPSGFTPGTNGHWIAPAAPIADPFAQVCYPNANTSYCKGTINGFSRPGIPSAPSGVTATNGTTSTVCTAAAVLAGTCTVRYQENGCPDHSGCTLFEPGAYASGITVANKVVIFDPGLYYVTGGLTVKQNTIVRPGTGPGDGSGGVTFYLNGTGTVSLDANSGKAPGSDVVDPFNTMVGPSLAGVRYPGVTTTSPYYYGVVCINSGAGATVLPANIRNGGAGVNIPGNILLGPCTGYYGDPLGTAESATIGEQRWFLFFQDRSATGVQPALQGGAAFLLAGTMYFHSCGSTSGDSGAGVLCTPPPSSPSNTNYFQDIMTLQGNTGSSTYVLGEIVTDNLGLGGGGTIVMDLNPTTAFNVLKASLYQ